MEHRESAGMLRHRLGQLSSLVGALGLMIGLVALIWFGGFTPVTITALMIGVVGLVAWVIITPDDALALIRRRQVRHSTVTVFAAALLLALIVSVYIAAQRAFVLIDMTASGEYSLSAETLNVISKLERPVQITGFYSPTALPQRELDDQFFRLYASESGGRIQINYINPVEQPAIAEAFGARNDGDVFVSYVDEAGQIEFDTSIQVARAGAQERDVTRALLLLSQSGQYSVAFEIGYSRIEQNDTSETGMSRFIQGLEFNGFVTGAINLRSMIEQGGTIPDEVSVLVMAQMVEDLPAEAVEKIADYVSRGGSLLIMMDTDLGGGLQFLARDGVLNTWLWENFGLRAMDGVVVDPAISGATPLDVLSAAIPEDSELTRGLNDPEDQRTSVEFHTARPIDINPVPPVPNGLIIAASPASYAELNTDLLGRVGQTSFDINEDIAGPMNTAAWAHDRDGSGAKVVLVGDDDFATNEYVAAPVGNSILLTNAITWLTDFEQGLVFEPQGQATNIPVIFVTGQMLDQIGIITIILMPSLVLMIGAVVWIVRNRR